MKFLQTNLPGLVVVELRRFEDERGFFLETYERSRYSDGGITDTFVQDNHSRSTRGVLRGLHYQVRYPQAQMLTVMRGTIFDVAVDLRQSSPTFGSWYGTELSDSGGAQQIYMAPGFAHGFCVLSDWADLHYKVSRKYKPNDEGGLLWNDSDVGIQWPYQNPYLCDRDSCFPRLRDLSASMLPHEQHQD